MKATVSARVQEHQQNLRSIGLRPIQIWVPDVRRQSFIDECRRQSTLLTGDPLEKETMDWLSSVADTEGWE